MNDAIVACARGWIGTRFHHQGRLKKTNQHQGGVDCLGLLVGVSKELELRDIKGKFLSDFDEQDYTHTPDTELLKQKLASLLTETSRDEIAPGDIVILNVDNSPQHLAIVSDLGEMLGLIHAYAPAKKVVEHGLDDFWRQKIIAAFRTL